MIERVPKRSRRGKILAGICLLGQFAWNIMDRFPLRKIFLCKKENFVKCDWPTQIFRRCRKIIFLKLKIFNFQNDIFGKFSVRGNFSCDGPLDFDFHYRYHEPICLNV
jgi:hypothetical protein